MEWTESIRKTVDYLEEHLLDFEEIADVSDEVGISRFYLQKGFRLMTGYSMAEYVRNRRLYLAALDVTAGREKIIELSYKYGYDTPESFSKAFSRFHGVTPVQLRKDASKMHVFLPLKIKIEIQGGNEMDYIVEKMENFQIIGLEREFSFDTSYEQIPKYWDEFCADYLARLTRTGKPANELEETILKCHVGMFGVCIGDSGNDGKFRYMIAGIKNGEHVPEGMTTYTFPDMEWAKFLCKGPLPEALQSVNTKIFKEWLPGNPQFEIAMEANVEWYSEGDTKSPAYESAVWIPVKRK